MTIHEEKCREIEIRKMSFKLFEELKKRIFDDDYAFSVGNSNCKTEFITEAQYYHYDAIFEWAELCTSEQYDYEAICNNKYELAYDRAVDAMAEILFGNRH